MFTHFWQFSFPVLALTLGFVAGHAWRGRHERQRRRWPRTFNLIARPVFTTEERLLFRELKTALPHHVVLAKINVLRLCQSASEGQARSWFERLHTMTVSFAICTPHGAVISVIDLDTPQRRKSERGQRLKEAVMEACRIRYVRCQPGQWPRPALMAAWALGTAPSGSAGGTERPSAPPASTLVAAQAELARKLHRRREERASRFRDSRFASDSFFATDSRFDSVGHSTSPPLLDAAPRAR